MKLSSLVTVLLALAVAVCAYGGTVKHIEHHCKHDLVQKQIDEENKKLRDPRGLRSEIDYNTTKVGLDIYADTEPLMHPLYDVVYLLKRSCRQKGDEIYWGGGSKYTCEEADVATTEKARVVQSIVESVFPEFKELLQVYDMNEPLEFEKGNYSGDICIGGNDCLSGTIGDPKVISVPGKHIYVQVTMRPDSDNVYATGTSLRYDQNGRTILGHINFNARLMPSSLNRNSNLWKEIRGVALHEMMHVLGFSAGRFSSYKDPATGLPYAVFRNSTVYSGGHTITMLVTPKVQEYTRQQFGCKTLAGAPLEDQGGSGTAGSHWEKATLMDEVMTGSASMTPVLSNITLALFEDSGWYFPNYSRGERLMWGEGQGCNFVEAKCEVGWPKSGGYFCTDRDAEECTYDRKAKGVCSIKTYSSMPQEYRHLGDSTEGGTIVLADYCPLVREYSNGFCTDSSTSTTLTRGDAVGPTSKCFMSMLSTIPLSDTVSSYQPLCYPAVCVSPEKLLVKIGKYWTECPSGGKVSDFDNFFGSLKCPDSKFMCGGSTVSYGAGLQESFPPVPMFKSLSPKAAKAGDRVTVCGENFHVNVSIKLGAECENVEEVNETCLSCQLKETSGFKTVAGPVDLTLSYDGYTTLYSKVFTMELDLKAWVKKNAFFLFAILFSILLLFIALITLMVKCHKTKKRYREYQERVRKAKAVRAAKERSDAGLDVEMDTVA